MFFFPKNGWFYTPACTQRIILLTMSSANVLCTRFDVELINQLNCIELFWDAMKLNAFE